MFYFSRCSLHLPAQLDQCSVNGGEARARDLHTREQTMKKTKRFKKTSPPSTPSRRTIHYPRTRTLSVDGTAVPKAKPIEDPQTPCLMTRLPEHPLQHSWTIYHDIKAKVPYTPNSSTANTQHAAPTLGLTKQA
ncbi:hypothetical protein BGW80DRAFT_452527 [Lactifluus volemus]|nr:hypothetical protein BGW80DRAFT_452527 [Lactifluus volemus]